MERAAAKRAERRDSRVVPDVFAAGAIIWWLATRTPPYPAHSKNHALMLRQRHPAGEPPDEIESVLLSALDPDPEQRPTSAGLQSELRNVTDLWLPDWRVSDQAVNSWAPQRRRA